MRHRRWGRARFDGQPRVLLPGSEKQPLTRSRLARLGNGLETSFVSTLMTKTVFEEPKTATGQVTVTAQSPQGKSRDKMLPPKRSIRSPL
jgi:hypothetical protein